MNESTYGPKSILLLSFAGLGSSLITIATANFVSSFGLKIVGGLGLTLVHQFYEGTVFGGTIAVYFVLRERMQSIVKVLIFICASVAAHWASMFVSFALFFTFHTKSASESPHLDIPPPVFFAGGFVGAFIVLGAALLLFGVGDSAARSIGKVLLCATGGGILGVIGWATGPFLGGALWLGLKALHLIPGSQTYQLAVDQNTLEYLSLPVVWQTGVALLLGLLLSSEDAIWHAPTSPVSSAASASADTARFERPKIPKFASILFFGGIFAFLGWQVSRIVRGQIAVMRRQHNARQMLAERPPSESLPSIDPMPVEKALLIERIEGLSAINPRVYRQPLRLDGPRSMPDNIQYSVGYAPVDGMILLAVTVTVSVQQFPNAAWARYRTNYPVFSAPLDDPESRSIVTKFGNRIVMDTAFRYPDGGGRLYLLWPNGNRVVTICYETRNVNEEILRRYLDKYPSSL